MRLRATEARVSLKGVTHVAPAEERMENSLRSISLSPLFVPRPLFLSLFFSLPLYLLHCDDCVHYPLVTSPELINRNDIRCLPVAFSFSLPSSHPIFSSFVFLNSPLTRKVQSFKVLTIFKFQQRSLITDYSIEGDSEGKNECKLVSDYLHAMINNERNPALRLEQRSLRRRHVNDIINPETSRSVSLISCVLEKKYHSDVKKSNYSVYVLLLNDCF